MVTLTKENVQLLDKVDPDKENLLIFGFRGNSPYSLVLIPAKFIALPGQDGDATKDGIPRAFTEARADEPTATENQILKNSFRQFQSLMSHERLLTHRELELLEYVSNGATNKEIAYQLDISTNTVRNMMAIVMCKLGAKSRAHAVALALRQGWISL